MGKILEFPPVETDDEIVDHVLTYLATIDQASNVHARRTLSRLYHAIRRQPLINYYIETNQKIDHVLDIFIRTNQGGTQLTFSDLLMSITAANWEDAREHVDELVNHVRTDLGFSIDRNFVMKAAAMITDADVRFRVRNFDATNVANIRSQWDDIRDAVVAAFRLVSSFGLNDVSLRAKNAVIPVSYYLFHKGRDPENGCRGLFTTINKPISNQGDRKAIRQWLLMSLLRGVFGFSGDALLTRLRNTIRANIDDPAGFPLPQIIDAARGTTRDLRFDGEFIENLLRTQKGDPSSYAILALLQPGLDINQILHLDHLHPAVAFRAERLDAHDFLNADPALREFYGDPGNWNSIVNLHLLSESENTSKKDAPLKQWLEARKGETLVDPLIPAGTDLAFEAFPEFVAARAGKVRSMLETLVGVPTAATEPVLISAGEVDV